MSISTTEFKNNLTTLVNESIDEILKLLKGTEKSLPHDPKELSYIFSSLTDLKKTLNASDFIDLKEMELHISRIVIDTWPLNDDLGKKICQIEYDFNKLKLRNPDF